MATGTINIPYKEVIVEQGVLDNIVVPANGNSSNVDLSITKSGYTFLGIVGYSIGAATTSGAGAGNCTLYRIIQSTTNARVALHNWGSSEARVKVDMQLLYVKT